MAQFYGAKTSGNLDSVSFGNGLNYSSGTETISQSGVDLSITGLGLSGSGSGNTVHNVVYGLMGSKATPLLEQLIDDDITVNGSANADQIYSFQGVIH